MRNDFPYSEMTEDFLAQFKGIEEDYGEIANAANIAATWLYNYDDSLLTETERLNVILPLIKFCVERNDLPPIVEGELEYYYDELSEGRLTRFLDPSEADAVIRDLEWSYHKAFPDEK